MKIRWGIWTAGLQSVANDDDDVRMQMKENEYFISNKTMQFES